jgi:hypothetical protein
MHFLSMQIEFKSWNLNCQRRIRPEQCLHPSLKFMSVLLFGNHLLSTLLATKRIFTPTTYIIEKHEFFSQKGKKQDPLILLNLPYVRNYPPFLFVW